MAGRVEEESIVRLSGSSAEATTKAPPSLEPMTPTRACDDKRLAGLQPVNTRQDVDGVGAEDDEHDHVNLHWGQAVVFGPTFLHAQLDHATGHVQPDQYARDRAAHHHHKVTGSHPQLAGSTQGCSGLPCTALPARGSGAGPAGHGTVWAPPHLQSNSNQNCGS